MEAIVFRIGRDDLRSFLRRFVRVLVHRLILAALAQKRTPRKDLMRGVEGRWIILPTPR
jgi:hypothetical protein